jgi:ribosomal protein L14E/L6E/L27E
LLKRGSVVRSLRGRDGERLMAVLEVTPDRVLVADGRKRRIENPKRKNPRHLAPIGALLDETSMASNRELRRALAKFGMPQN